MSVTTVAEPTGRAEVAPRGRRARRVVRHVEVWSVLKFSALLYLCLLIVALVAGTLLWLLAAAAGAIGNIETFIQGVGFDNFRFLGGQLLKAMTLSGLVLVLLGTGVNVMVAVLYNLISDVVGGIEVTVLEEELPRRPTI